VLDMGKKWSIHTSLEYGGKALAMKQLEALIRQLIEKYLPLLTPYTTGR